MRTFLWVVLVLDQLIILLILSLRFEKYEVSQFVLKKNLEQFNVESSKIWRKFYKMLPDIKTFWWAKTFILFAVSVTVLTYLINPILGTVYAVLGFFLIRIISRLKILQKYTTKIFESNISKIITIVGFFKSVTKLFGYEPSASAIQLSTKEEFLDNLQHLPSTVLDPWQKQRLESVLLAENKIVKQIMTPKRRAVTVTPSAILGPVLLSDLQKSGHMYFVVATKKGEPEGILRLSDITDINQAKQHTKASDLMSTHLSWVNEDANLLELLQIFLQEKQYLLIVRNLEGEYVGVVTIADFSKHTLGIVQE